MSEYRQSPEEEAGYVCLAEAMVVFQAATVSCSQTAGGRASLPRIQPAVGGLTVFSGIKVWWYSKLLQSSDGNVCRIAAESLGRLRDPRAAGPLIAALENGNSSAAHALRDLGAAIALQPLTTFLGRGHVFVRCACARVLGELGDARARSCRSSMPWRTCASTFEKPRSNPWRSWGMLALLSR